MDGSENTWSWAARKIWPPGLWEDLSLETCQINVRGWSDARTDMASRGQHQQGMAQNLKHAQEKWTWGEEKRLPEMKGRKNRK